MWLLKKNKKKISSRNQIAIKEVKDGILMLPNNQYRSVIETSSINFELKSEAEQDNLIDTFQNFLNSLPSTIQILVRTREIDIDHYLEKNKQSINDEKEQIYKDQIANYGEFVKKLVAGNKILSRHFYLIIPYQAQEKKQDFLMIKEQMGLLRKIFGNGLQKMGMKAKRLNSLEVLDLFYSFYNPDQTKTQELTSFTIKELVDRSYV